MCMQCLAKSELIKQDVLPGYSLNRSTVAHPDWPLGWYGIIWQNDPEFVFKGPVMLDPCHGLTEDDLDAMPEYPEGYDEYQASAVALSKVQFATPTAAYEFVQACVDSGYSISTHGSQLGFWLLHHLAKKVQEA